MLDIDNLTPFPEFHFRAVNGEAQLIDACVVRGTYELRNGEPHIADVQPGPKLLDSYYGDPKSSSLKEEHDWILPKPRGEIYFVDPVSRRPADHASNRWRVRAQVASIDFAMQVTGPREYRRSLFAPAVSEPGDCDAVELRFENSYGGKGEEQTDWFDANPVGSGYRRSKSTPLGSSVRAPQLETLDGRIPNFPLALTPVSRGWTPRRSFAGTCDDRWLNTRAPLFPEDFDPRFFQQAPEHLQLAEGCFRGDEHVRISGIGPASDYRFQLPEPRTLMLVVWDAAQKSYCAEFQLDTLILDLENGEFSLVWRTSFLLPDEAVGAAILFEEDKHG